MSCVRNYCILPSSRSLSLPATAGGAKPDGDKQVEYSVVEVVFPSDPDCVAGFWQATVARRMNERGEVVGDDICYVATDDPLFPLSASGGNAFRWTRASGATLLASLGTGPVGMIARDINERGTAIGWEFRSDGSAFAPLWPRAGGVSAAIEPQGCDFLGLFALGEGINDRGTVLARDARPTGTGNCGVFWILKLASGEEFVGPNGGQPRQLNNNGIAVGGNTQRAIRWSPKTGVVVLYEDPTGQNTGLGWAINDRNEAVGSITHFDQQSSCFTTQQAAFWAANTRQTILGTLRGDVSAAAFGINGRSQVVGQSYTQTPCEFAATRVRAVIWQGTRAVDLNSLVPKRFAREFQLTNGSAINDRGQIVAHAIRRGEPESPCPSVDFDPETGENVYNPSTTCQNVYSFLLTPNH